jgi:hypothetical protein
VLGPGWFAFLAGLNWLLVAFLWDGGDWWSWANLVAAVLCTIAMIVELFDPQY